MCRSVRQTPHAWTATSASPGPGSGSSRSAARRSGRAGARRGPWRAPAHHLPSNGMAAPTDIFDLGRLRLSSGEGRRLTLGVRLGDFDFGGQRYAVGASRSSTATLDVSRMTAGGYALRLRFDAGLTGPCMRCLEPAAPVTSRRRPRGPPARRRRGAHEPVRARRGPRPRRLGARRLRARAARRRSSARRTAPGCARSAARTSTRPGPSTTTSREPDPRWAKLRELRARLTA